MTRPPSFVRGARGRTRPRRVSSARLRRGGAVVRGCRWSLTIRTATGILRPTKDRFAKPKARWWRPASTVGRVFLAIGAVAVLSVATAACLMVKHSLERDARFRIAGAENIQATGLTEVSRAQLLPVFGEDIGRNIFFVPLSQRRKQLEQIPWVERRDGDARAA